MTGRLLLAFCVLSVAALSFLLGGAVMVIGLPPSQSMRGAVNAMLGQLIPAPDRDPGSAYNAIFKLWVTPRSAEAGVTRIDRDAVEPGYTLYTDLTAEEARLVDIDGHLVHRWSLPLEKIWAPDDDAPAPADYEALRWEKVRIFPDGSLMAVVMASNATPYGRALVRIDRESHLVWKNLAHIHHDFDIAPDGRIFALSHRLSDEVPRACPSCRPPSSRISCWC